MKMNETIDYLTSRLLCQDMEKKLAVWFESRLDARETFRKFYQPEEKEIDHESNSRV